MTDRVPLDAMTSDQLDELYDLLDYLTGCLASTYELSGGEVLAVAREAIDADRQRAACAAAAATPSRACRIAQDGGFACPTHDPCATCDKEQP